MPKPEKNNAHDDMMIELAKVQENLRITGRLARTQGVTKIHPKTKVEKKGLN